MHCLLKLWINSHCSINLTFYLRGTLSSDQLTEFHDTLLPILKKKKSLRIFSSTHSLKALSECCVNQEDWQYWNPGSTETGMHNHVQIRPFNTFLKALANNTNNTSKQHSPSQMQYTPMQMLLESHRGSPKQPTNEITITILMLPIIVIQVRGLNEPFASGDSPVLGN